MATKNKDDLRRVKLRGVRLSFPHLYEPQTRENDDGTTRENYNCALMIPKDHVDIDDMRKALKRAGQEARKKAWGEDESNWPRIPGHRQFFRDGDNPDHTEREEYSDHFFINASAPVSRPPQIVSNRKDKNGKWIPAEPGQANSPYAGCYVTAVIEIWGQKKDTKKNIPNRLNATIEIVQFHSDGEAFGAAPVDPNDYLDDDDVSDEGEISGGDYGDDDDGDDEDGLI